MGRIIEELFGIRKVCYIGTDNHNLTTIGTLVMYKTRGNMIFIRRHFVSRTKI